MRTLPKISSIVALAFVGLSAASARAHEEEEGDADDLGCEDAPETEERLPTRATRPEKKGSGFRAPGILAGGIVTTVVGLVPSIMGLALIVEDESEHDDWFDGLGTTFGTALGIVGIVHLAVGVPMIVVGSERKDAEEGPAEGPVVRVSTRGAGADLTVSF